MEPRLLPLGEQAPPHGLGPGLSHGTAQDTGARTRSRLFHPHARDGEPGRPNDLDDVVTVHVAERSSVFQLQLLNLIG